jgi:hypothetical protein
MGIAMSYQYRGDGRSLTDEQAASGVWRIDPAEYGVSPAAITQAANVWAKRSSRTVKKMTDGGLVYVQFARKP